MNLHIIILAAGKGTRMRSQLPKVLHQLAGKPLLAHVIETAATLNPHSISVVYGDGKAKVLELLHHYSSTVTAIEQAEQLGTGHAVMQAIPTIPNDARVLILYGDVPLISTQLLQEFILTTPPFALGVLTVELDNPSGFGRIIRDQNYQVCAICEQKDATAEQLKIKEINTGILLGRAELFKKQLPRLSKKNAQNEYYLTDIIGMLHAEHVPVQALLTKNNEEVLGINDRAQLAHLERHYQLQQARQLMLNGVTLADPARFDIRGKVNIASDVFIDINVILEGKVTIESHSTIGQNCSIKNCSIGKNVTIRANCVIEEATIEDNCIVGPFARVRPGSQLAEGAHVGNFVEVKNTVIGPHSKANHLTYLGDTVIGKNVNVGAGTITCNYDGVNKYQTIIKDGAFIGSNTALVAPITVGANATIGAGSTLVSNAPENKLTLCRAQQVTIEDWERPKKKS